jgi:hypothetical protein
MENGLLWRRAIIFFFHRTKAISNCSLNGAIWIEEIKPIMSAVSDQFGLEWIKSCYGWISGEGCTDTVLDLVPYFDGSIWQQLFELDWFVLKKMEETAAIISLPSDWFRFGLVVNHDGFSVWGSLAVIGFRDNNYFTAVWLVTIWNNLFCLNS